MEALSLLALVAIVCIEAGYWIAIGLVRWAPARHPRRLARWLARAQS